MSATEEPLSGNVFSDMRAFDKKYGFNDVSMTPKFLAFRVRFLIEELYEGIKAIEANDPEGFVDAMIDLIVVAAGTLSIGRVDGQKAWDEVMRANMSKERGTTSRPGSGGADLVKPKGWTAPDHTENIGTFQLIDAYEFRQYFPHSLTVLLECMEMQCKKFEDYNKTLVTRADYWIHGIHDLEYEMNKKFIRFRSVLAKVKEGGAPAFESLTDSLEDNINYNSFAVSLIRGMEPGQNSQLNLFGEVE